MRVWVTRAEPGAAATAQRLRDLGHEPFVSPLLEVRGLDTALDLGGVAALAFTSPNGVAAFAEREPACDLPVFAVGDATAETARAVGFIDVRSASGDVAALARLIIADPPKGVILHPGARHPAGDLVGDLARAGISAAAAALYETVAVSAPAPLPVLDAVLIHSPRAALALAPLGAVRTRPVLCISAAAAAPLLAGNFTAVATAPFPNEAALLKLLLDTAAAPP